VWFWAGTNGIRRGQNAERGCMTIFNVNVSKISDFYRNSMTAVTQFFVVYKIRQQEKKSHSP
jgi:hypothetical protein